MLEESAERSGLVERTVKDVIEISHMSLSSKRSVQAARSRFLY